MKLSSRCEWSLGKMVLSALTVLLLAACGGGTSSGTTGTTGATGSTGSSVGTPTITSYFPTTAVVGKSTSYVIKGVNLPDNVTVKLADGSCLTPTDKTSTSFSVVCTAGNNGATIATSVNKVMSVTGSWWLGQQELVVMPQPALTFSPNTAAPGVATTFLIGNGTDLTSTVDVTLAEGSCAAPTAITATSFSVVCTAGATEGNKSMIVRHKPLADGGFWLGQQELVVGASPSSGPPLISSFSPKSAVVGVATSYLVKGVNLPSTVNVTLADGSCLAPTDKTSTGFSVVCTAGLNPGTRPMVVRSKAASDGGFWIDSQDVEVTAAPRSTVTLLNDTGITSNQCYAAASDALFGCTSPDAVALNDRQDGMAGRDPANPDNNDGLLGASYRVAGPVATPTDCVKDEVSGYTWQRVSKTLTALPGDAMNQEAIALRDAANTSKLCGYSDWAIPSRAELQSLLNYGRTTFFAIDLNWFDLLQAWYYSATPYLSGASSNVWIVDFSRGQVSGIGALTGSPALRLVRATTPVVPRFTFTTSGEVNDALTGLIWQRCALGQTWLSTTETCNGDPTLFSHAGALTQAKPLSQWRVPNIKELASLVDPTRLAPAIDTAAFKGTTSAVYWSSTPDVMNPAAVWTVDFGVGSVLILPRSSTYYVRLVR